MFNQIVLRSLKKKTAVISQYHQWLRHKLMSEEREEKFHTNDINQIWLVTHHQYGISAHIPILRCHFLLLKTLQWRLFSQAKIGQDTLKIMCISEKYTNSALKWTRNGTSVCSVSIRTKFRGSLDVFANLLKIKWLHAQPWFSFSFQTENNC